MNQDISADAWLGWYLFLQDQWCHLPQPHWLGRTHPDFEDSLCRMQCFLSRRQVARLWSSSGNTTTDFLQPLFLYIQELRREEENAESAKKCWDSCGCLRGTGIQLWGHSLCWQINSLEKLQWVGGEGMKKVMEILLMTQNNENQS